MKSQNIIEEKSFKFALQIIELYKQLIEEKEFVISKQLLRCGTSIGANVVEAEAGFSHKDFTAKMSIASKEGRETRYWLRLLKFSNLTDIKIDVYLQDIDEIIRILTSIVKTAQRRQKKFNT